jgi:hypothetical protein
VEQLFNHPPLAAQKPSELLVEMLCHCPRGQENNVFLNCLFLNKLPRELRILLSEADLADKQTLGARADLFAAHNSKQGHDVVAVVAAGPLLESEGEETTVAAVRPDASSGGGQRGGSWRGKKKPGLGGGVGSGQQVSHTPTHMDQARLEAGLCYPLFCYGAKPVKAKKSVIFHSGPDSIAMHSFTTQWCFSQSCKMMMNALLVHHI